MFDQLKDMNIFGLVFMLISAIMVYGARFIVLKIFKFPEEDSLKPIIILKLSGILVATFGMLRIFNII